MVIFSTMQGIFHEYYTVAMAPAIAALVGMGASDAWERRGSFAGRAVLALAVAVTAIWSFRLLSTTSAYGTWLRAGVLEVGLASSLLILLVPLLPKRAIRVVLPAALTACLAGPAAWSISTTMTGHTGTIVLAGPVARRDVPVPSDALVSALVKDSSQYTWVASTVGSQNAAGLQLATRLPVMPLGGFNGSDPSPTLMQFQQYVAEGRIHLFYDEGAFGRRAGSDDESSKIARWVNQHFTPVVIDGVDLYDLTLPLASS